MDRDVLTDTGMLMTAFREFRLGMQYWLEKTNVKTGLTHPQLILLAVLDAAGESTMTALTEKMGTTMGAVTNLADRLVHADLVEREHDTEDRRVVKVRLTDKGRELVRQATYETTQYLARFFGQVPEKDRKAFIAIYRTMGEQMNADALAEKKSAKG
jgi:DNA-binding MarR family transcriptional regulator